MPDESKWRKRSNASRVGSIKLIELQAEVKKRQSKLATLIGSDVLQGTETQLEMIPHVQSWFPDLEWKLATPWSRGFKIALKSKPQQTNWNQRGLQIKVTRTELVPQLNAVVGAYLAALNGNYQLGKSFVDQFNNGPGYLAGLQYEMPRWSTGGSIALSRSPPPLPTAQ